jgi:hypothetical protein
MTRVVVLLLVFLVGPTSAGELLRYRTADGSVGFVDDERRLPPDAVIVSRTARISQPGTAAVPAEDPADPSEPAQAVLDDDGRTSAVPEDLQNCASQPERRDQLHCWSEHHERCHRFGLRPRCTAEELASAERWCDRGELLRSEWTPIEELLASAIENHRACRSRARPGVECPRDEVLEAERAAQVWDLRVAALEEQCHEQGCLPGWVRERCKTRASP